MPTVKELPDWVLVSPEVAPCVPQALMSTGKSSTFHVGGRDGPPPRRLKRGAGMPRVQPPSCPQIEGSQNPLCVVAALVVKGIQPPQ